MTETIAKNTQDSKSSTEQNKDFSTITPGLSTTKFLNYQPIVNKDQHYTAPRRRGPHYSIDYGSNANITLGSTILAVQGGEATPMMNWYKNSKSGVMDAGVRIKSKDPETGNYVYTTYGHLSQESVREMFPNGKSKTVKAGDEIGEVGTTGKAARNEYHVHVDVVNANQNGSKGPHNKNNSQNPLEYFKKVANAAERSSSTNNSNDRDTEFVGSVTLSSDPAFVGSVDRCIDTAFTGSFDPNSDTAFTGQVASNTALRVSLDTALRAIDSQQPQQTQQSGMSLSQ